MLQRSRMIFFELKTKLSEQQNKKATWEEVAFFYQIPFFEDKTSKQISMLLSTWKKRGTPARVELWIIKNIN